jgi:ketosteroid isomerase-like protein
VTDTQVQLQQLIDAEAIRELIYSYARCADDGDNERMVSLFVDDCTAEFGPGEVLFGKDQLLAWLTKIQSTIVASSHFMTNIDIRFDRPDHAIGHHYLYSFGRFVGYPDVGDKHRWCRYENSYRRTPVGWRIEALALYASVEYGGDRAGEARGRVWPPADFRRWPATAES